MHKKGLYEKYFKRLLDIFCAALGIIFFSWLYILIAVMVKIKIGSPIIFRQPRPGKNEKIFNMYKFRTMTNECDENGILLPDDKRLTKFGKFLRSTSIDELPELINIIRGDMAIVGPRPLLVSYLPLYNQRQARRHEVRPGFTGYAQVHGRNSITWEDKFEKDIYYVDNISFLGDLKIIFETIRVVIKKEGITSATSATMEAFKKTKNTNIKEEE